VLAGGSAELEELYHTILKYDREKESFEDFSPKSSFPKNRSIIYFTTLKRLAYLSGAK
jgi:hypothetical protein